MCGIAGVSRATPSSIPDGRELARELAYALESRGPHAVGFAWIQEAWPHYWKAPGRARDVAADADLPIGMKTFVVHTRYATKGAPEVNDNNHPIVAPGLTLVHNGVLSNDDELIAELGWQRSAEVDSEALAALVSEGPAHFGESIPKCLERVKGDAAIAWVDGDSPDTLHLARLAGRPLVVGWTVKGDLIAASTGQALDAAARKIGVRITHTRIIAEGTYLRVIAGRIVEQVTFAPHRSRFYVQTHPARYGPIAAPTPGPSYATPGERSTMSKRQRKRARRADAARRQQSALSMSADSMVDPFDDDQWEYEHYPSSNVDEPTEDDLAEAASWEAQHDEWEREMDRWFPDWRAKEWANDDLRRAIDSGRKR